MTQYISLSLIFLLGSASFAITKSGESEDLKSGLKSPEYKFGYMSFGIAVGTSPDTKPYTISNFVGSEGCYSYTNKSSKTSITPGGHIMCRVFAQSPLPNSMGKFTMTVTDANNNSCVISTQPTDPYTYSNSCNITGVTIVNADSSYENYKYGDWQVNLQ